MAFTQEFNLTIDTWTLLAAAGEVSTLLVQLSEQGQARLYVTSDAAPDDESSVGIIIGRGQQALAREWSAGNIPPDVAVYGKSADNDETLITVMGY